MNFDKNKPQGIDACYAQIKQHKEDKKRQGKEQFDRALKEIRECCGIKEIGAYTLQDAINFLCQKYNAREISVEECKDYVVIDFAYKEEEFVSMLTEGYISDDSCKILLLPAKYQGKIQGDVKKNGAVLFLDYEDGKVSFWYRQGHFAGYNKELFAALDIFKSKAK